MPSKFTRIMKVADIMATGVAAEVIPTYCALADYSNNKTGLCWPKMSTLAKTLKKSTRTVQRHLRALREAGLIEFVERRRNKGKFSSYLYRISHIVATGHGQRVETKRSNIRRTKHTTNTPKPPEMNRGDREADAARRSDPSDAWFYR